MNLYLITSKIPDPTYDTYDSAVVCARNAADAKDMHPNGDYLSKTGYRGATWPTRASDVAARFLGTAGRVKRGVICASFNAG